jgi:hypothetical protein
VPPPRLQKYVRPIAIKMHNILEKQYSIHRDGIYLRLSGHISSLETILHFYSEHISLDLP